MTAPKKFDWDLPPVPKGGGTPVPPLPMLDPMPMPPPPGGITEPLPLEGGVSLRQLLDEVKERNPSDLHIVAGGIEADEGQTVIEAFRDHVPVDEGTARHLLARFLFYGSAVFGKVRRLSGGEKMRLRLAQLMYQHVNLLLLDEPTNHLDIESREVLEEALQQFDGTIVAISHDRYFLNKVFDKTYWLENRSLKQYLGNYDEAKQKLRLLYVSCGDRDGLFRISEWVHKMLT
jgi:hypothetical protein